MSTGLADIGACFNDKQFYIKTCSNNLLNFFKYLEQCSQGGESRDLNDRVHGISCRYSDKTSKQTHHTFLNTQWIFIKQRAHTS